MFLPENLFLHYFQQRRSIFYKKYVSLKCPIIVFKKFGVFPSFVLSGLKGNMVLNQLSFYHYRLSKISKTYENYFYCQHLTFLMLWYFPRNSWIFFHFRVSWYIGMQGETGPNKNFYSTYITTKDLISNFSTLIGYFLHMIFRSDWFCKKNCLPQKSNSPMKDGAPSRPYCSACIKGNKNGFFSNG